MSQISKFKSPRSVLYARMMLSEDIFVFDLFKLFLHTPSKMLSIIV